MNDSDLTDADSDNDQDNENTNDDNIDIPARRKSLRSTVWKYFDKIDSTSAKCRLCCKFFSYKTTVSNLRKHLKRKHMIEATKEKIEDTIWKYFKCLDEAQQIAECKVCKKRINYESHLELLSHVRKKHNNQLLNDKNKKLYVTDDNKLFIMEQEETKVKPEPEHSDDDQSDSICQFIEESPSTPKRKYTEKPIIEYYNTDTKNKYLQTTPKEPQEDSLELFGKYLVTLMRKLPQTTSNRLQVEFIKEVMNAQNSELDLTNIRILASEASVVPNVAVRQNDLTVENNAPINGDVK